MITTLNRSATSLWEGTGLEGEGKLSTRSKAIEELPYSHRSRFKNEEGLNGTNPEELIAAAHSGCFNMALSFQLNGAGYTAKELETTAKVILAKEGYDYSISKIELNLRGSVPGIEFAEFKELAIRAKLGCPVSQALSAVDISLEISLV
jgi:osmotically inducible protein OsmC